MKKTFSFTVPNKNRERQIDSIKFEIKKYIARERRKELPDKVDFWDFDCRIGLSEEQAQVIHLNSIKKSISQLASEDKEGFYLEILVKPGFRKKKEETIQTEDEEKKQED